MEGKFGGGGEVRRLHIIYFLSHMGRAEHPHLIRVHHLTRTGVYLRDVKRWLGELRGTDMAESYAWSYKRRYKSGYVWQDLVDDDLITPLSDNEYVIKGSQIIFSSSDSSRSQKGNTKYPAKIDNQQRKEESFERNKKDPPSRIFSEINEEEESSSSSSSASEISSITGDEFQPVIMINEKNINEKKEKKINDEVDLLNLRRKKSVSNSNTSPSKSRKSFSSNTLRNLITCGGLDTNDTALVSLNNKNDRLAKSSREFRTIQDPSYGKSSRASSRRRSFDDEKGSKNKQQQQQRAVPANYRPVKEPNCSQCGKTFKPQKMHSHMKSCRGMKSSSKSSVSKPQCGFVNPIYKDSTLGYLLTN